MGVQENHRVGGTVRDAAGDPVANAWVVLTETGAFTVSDREGRWRFGSIAAGEHAIAVRAPDGAAGQATMTVPGRGADVIVAAAGRKRS